MNEQERKVMDLLCQTHLEFMKLEQTHPADVPSWIAAVHRMQDIILSRITRRDYPKDFATYIKNSDTNEWEKKDMETSDFDKKKEEGKMAFELYCNLCGLRFRNNICGDRRNLRKECNQTNCPYIVNNKE